MSQGENRYRSGYLWASDEENKRIHNLIASSGILKASKSLSSKADFLRIAAIAMGELLKRKKIKIRPDSTQEEIIEVIVSNFLK